MTCEGFQERFADYLSGRIKAAEKKALKDHLAGCETCRHQLKQMEVVWLALGDLPERQPSPALRSRFYAMLESEKRREAEKGSFSGRITRWMFALWPRRPAFQFAFAVGFFIVGLLIGGRIQTGMPRNGEMAAKGAVNDSLLHQLLSHPFIGRPPPKTTGREEFGELLAHKLIYAAEQMGISDLDLLATVTAYTAECIWQNYEKFVLPKYDVSEILVSGGGLRNLTLMELLRKRFHPIPVMSVEDFGLSSDAKEAIAFAVLANETIHGNPGNVPSATGADGPVVLGKVAVR